VPDHLRLSPWLWPRVEALGPRHPHSARLYAAVIVAAATVAFLVAALTDQSLGLVHVTTAFVLSAVAGALVLLPARKAMFLCVLAPLIGVAAIVVVDVQTRDAGISGQIFFCLPVLYAATQLKVVGGIVVTLGAVAGEGAVVLLVLPAGQAVTDVLHVGTTLALIAVVLIRAGVIQDRLVAQLRRQAAIDPLTGLVTRRVLDEATQSAITGAEAQVGTSLVMIDVDRFKAVNDTHGHVVGDDVLSHIAGILTKTSRVHDVIARMGGDELAVLMPGCSYQVAVRRAEEFVALVRDTPFLLPGGASLALSISAGASHAPQHGARARSLYASADAALYAAKRDGRGRVGQVPDTEPAPPTPPDPGPPGGRSVPGRDASPPRGQQSPTPRQIVRKGLAARRRSDDPLR
jgi:diguanylate cyclase (GGDEF)-like protein